MVFRRGRGTHLALFTCGREGERSTAPPLTVRDEQGRRTPEYVEVLRTMRILP